ncbi:hypothetical protein I6F10_16555 [Pseudoalteromonas sp. SWYJZ98]|uniref:hypothetical protein n=2 Tax=unclassified Pseudoalteromonas TaxID=194690 RepID=UPI0018CD7FDD|nr:hypothetical protein [Pseudoalteromonas sp. SWYJZ98]MBH0032427.1 hypothetical protein [Pseudoalteromonas sp. SWYJZ98]
MSGLIVKEELQLPSLPTTVLPALAELTASLGIPRNVLASSEEIEYAWKDLPRELREIPNDLRGELIARMCVAVSTGLFDGAMNYAWNAAILQLRQKIRNFGLAVVAQIQQSDFEERHLSELQDSRLLELCLKLNIINEDGFFFLDQCRDVRNNFSAAHPTMGTVNDREFTTFLNRCVRYALADSSSPKGVDIGSFISAVKGPRFNLNQCNIWIERLQETHDAQRQMLLNMVHGIYCDPATPEPSRLNSLDICHGLKDQLTSTVRSELINNHSEYVAKGLEDKHVASLQFFEKLGLLGILNESEQHTVFSRAIDRLWNAHNGMNNFYNEAPFAERLLELSQQGAIPETVQEQFVQTVGSCRTGNGYGVANNAVSYYNKIIQGFSPREIATLIRSAGDNSNPLGRRIRNYSSCKRNFKSLLNLIDASSVPSGVKTAYDQFIR